MDFHQQWQSTLRDKWILRTDKKGLLLDLQSASPPCPASTSIQPCHYRARLAQLAACQTTVDSFIAK